MRHRLVHDYGRVNLNIVWQVIERDIPALITAIAPYIERIAPESDA